MVAENVSRYLSADLCDNKLQKHARTGERPGIPQLKTDKERLNRFLQRVSVTSFFSVEISFTLRILTNIN